MPIKIGIDWSLFTGWLIHHNIFNLIFVWWNILFDLNDEEREKGTV